MKLIVLAIPPLTVGGLLWVAYEVHGRVPPTALFAVPFAYNFPFLFGFVNFALAMALALIAFAFWLQARAAQPGLAARRPVRADLARFCGSSTPSAGGRLGVLAFSAELVRQHDRGRSYPMAAFQCRPALPGAGAAGRA